MKIDRVKITNFKSLKDVEIPLSNLNLITGINSIVIKTKWSKILFIKRK